MKKVLVVLMVITVTLLLAACKDLPEPTISPLPTPVSPLPTPVGGPVIAQGDEEPSEPPAVDVPGLVDVLTLLASGVGVGSVIAFLFERFSWFQNLTGDQRWRTIFGFSIGLPLVAQALVQNVPAEVWAAIEPYWRAAAAGFLTWAGSQAVHFGRKFLIERSQRE